MMVCHLPKIKILGIPVGQPKYVLQFLEEKSDEHGTLFQRIPIVEKAALLLLTCANFSLRGVQQTRCTRVGMSPTDSELTRKESFWLKVFVQSSLCSGTRRGVSLSGIAFW